jgi:hypothetical protein
MHRKADLEHLFVAWLNPAHQSLGNKAPDLFMMERLSLVFNLSLPMGGWFRALLGRFLKLAVRVENQASKRG